MLDVAFCVTDFQARGVGPVNTKHDTRFTFRIGNDQLRVAVLRFQLGAFDTLAALNLAGFVWTAIVDAQTT
jgi:hypothetical protein